MDEVKGKDQRNSKGKDTGYKVDIICSTADLVQALLFPFRLELGNIFDNRTADAEIEKSQVACKVHDENPYTVLSVAKAVDKEGHHQEPYSGSDGEGPPI